MSQLAPKTSLLDLTTKIVCAYVENNNVSKKELPILIDKVDAALLAVGESGAGKPLDKAKPAVPIKESLQDEYIVCLEDGLRFKTLKRHIRSKYNMTPEQYRIRWNLAADYPMVARNYAKKRSQIAKEIKLGRKTSK